ncbi:integral membrane protein [Colletotrichum tofieldiae]|uniref:Integral membrane protein n=1 Tax=Colletotrichum tofieldiae TaxID=708197 RepID=A0A166YR69_9PEZI|nr:integral membrane protein [Colletotrichum tofieldiae]
MSNATSPVGAFPPPPGVIPNFESPRDAGWMLNVVGMSVMAAITTFFFAIRAYVKFSLASPFLPEDWTCAASYALIMLYIAVVFVMAHYGEGYHAWEITKEAYQEVMRWLYASSIIYIPAAYFTKVTLLLLEARVFAVHERTSRGIRIFIITLFICYVPLQTLKTVICLPISSFWDPRTPNPKCLNQRKIFIADLSLAIITDFIILVLPIPLLWGLRMPLRKKLKILTLLGAGGIATAVTVYRMYLVVQFLTSKDVTADFVVLDIVTQVYLARQTRKRTGINYNFRALELVIGVVCACLPSMNILYERMRRGGTKPTGNLPRTAHDIKRDSMGSSYLWSMMTRKHSKPARTEFTVAKHATSPDYRSNFDTELAILTGQPMGTNLPKEELDTEIRQNPDDWVYNPRANSMDGRREGWLAPGAESSIQGFERERMPNWQHHEIEARKSWEAVWERVMPMGGLPSIPEDDGPPRLELTTHPPPDWEHLGHG